MNSEQIKFDFNTMARKGLISIIYGKGITPSIAFLCSVPLLLAFIFFLLPYNKNLAVNAFRFFLVLLCGIMIYSFNKSLIEIVIEEDNIQWRTFKQYQKIMFDSIHQISIYYFATSGSVFIRLKVEGKSIFYGLWAPKFEPERYQLFLKFVNSIKEASKGRFTLKFRT